MTHQNPKKKPGRPPKRDIFDTKNCPHREQLLRIIPLLDKIENYIDSNEKENAPNLYILAIKIMLFSGSAYAFIRLLLDLITAFKICVYGYAF